MKKTSGLGLLVACAVLLTACGSQEKTEPKPVPVPEQVLVQPDVARMEAGKEAAAEGETKPDANGKQANQGQSTQAGQSNKSGSPTAAKPSGASGTSTSGQAGGTSAPATSGSGASAPPKQAATAGTIDLFVTEYFGASTVFGQAVGYRENQMLIDVMRDHLDIETAYGGGFVNGINGTKSGYTDKSIFTRKKRDWFYYVNGSIGAIGADQQGVHSGDVVWCDYHDCSGSGSNAPCVVGAYPHPFTTGYNGAQPGTVIYYSGQHADDANRLAQGLRGLGAGNVTAKPYADGNILHASSNVIVLGTWSELAGQAAMEQVFGSPKDTGVFATFEGETVQGLTYQGKKSDATGQGAILATGAGNGDTSPLWLVVGATEAGLDQAVDLLVSGGGKLKGKIGVIVDGGTAVGVPAE